MRGNIFKRVVIGCLLCLIAGVASAATPAGLRVRFVERAVYIEGMSSAPVSVLVVGLRRVEYRNVMWMDVQRVVGKGDGTAEVPLREDVAPFTIAVAIDEEDGRTATVGANIGLAPVRGPIDPLKRDNLGQIMRAEFQTLLAHVLLVRPGRGSWSGTIGDGTANDEDRRRDHILSVGFRSLKGRDGNGGPDHLLPRDVLAVVDPQTMRVSVIKVEK